MRKIILTHHLSPGDVTMLTAVVRDIKKAHGDAFQIDVRTSCDELWENNPYITNLDSKDKDVETIQCDYPLIHNSNEGAYHFIHGFYHFLEDHLKIKIPVTKFKGDIHISDDEKGWISQIEELGIKDNYWIIMAGGKYDFTAKWWNPKSYQKVVNHFRGKITFIQCGESTHWHPPLKNIVNLIGKTDTRQYIRLVYHSVGVLCPVTFAMHAAAAIPVKDGRPLSRACVVIAGGREPSQWEEYPQHRFLSVNGCLDCCDNGGCWKSRCQKVGDGDEKDTKDLCIYPVQIESDLCIPKCLDMISANDVIRAIEMYYIGGSLKYGSNIKLIDQLNQAKK